VLKLISQFRSLAIRGKIKRIQQGKLKMTTKKQILDYIDFQPSTVKEVFSSIIEQNSSLTIAGTIGTVESALRSMADKETGYPALTNSQLLKNLEQYDIEQIVEQYMINVATNNSLLSKIPVVSVVIGYIVGRMTCKMVGVDWNAIVRRSKSEARECMEWVLAAMIIAGAYSLLQNPDLLNN
jgi:hypothetical protein